MTERTRSYRSYLAEVRDLEQMPRFKVKVQLVCLGINEGMGLDAT
jgi:hypothetical protein